jgi:hypothetical protein
MFKTENKKAQAAVEFAVFGAILVFLLGTIVRSAVSNSYAQNQNFKAMRMAMLASWNGSKAGTPAHNSATILFIEDRLSTDFNKYGDLDRNPFVANGSGTFSFELLYPLDVGEAATNLPIMDVYINGQHFPFTTASYVPYKVIARQGCPAGGPYPPPADGGTLAPWQCLQNQCLRNAREWVGGSVDASQFDNVIPIGTLGATTSATLTANGLAIFQALINAGFVSTNGGSSPTSGFVTNAFTQMPPAFTITDPTTDQPVQLTQGEIGQIQNILKSNGAQYKLFYTMVANGEEDQWNTTPPVCANPNTLACKDKALSSTMAVPFTTCPSGNINGAGLCVNSNGDMEYDLLRLGDYVAVDTQFPTVASCAAASMRCNIAWQWAATAATTPSQIGLVPSSNSYPSYDIDGRLKPVTIYTLSQDSSGAPTVSYEDFQGGDIDSTWDINSCGPKPGLQNDTQIYTFTQNGTYLQILEGKLYNPETDQFVRSANKRDNIDLVQREIQLSNDTGRFCSVGSPVPTVSGETNPVEVCVAAGSGSNCFSGSNVNGQVIAQTCFDGNDNMLFVRSRLEDKRGSLWMTDTSGQLQVQ